MKQRYPGWVAVILLSLPLLVSAAGELPLVAAARGGDRETITALLQQSIDVNAAEADGTTALHWAALRNDMDIARLLLLAEADTDPANDYGVTPLWLACTNRSDGMVELLLQAGADTNLPLVSGATVLMNCARTGAEEAVAALLSVGADVNAAESSQGQTALMWAAAGGRAGITRLLLEHGADIGMQTIDTAETISHSCGVCSWQPSPGGFTAFLFAARAGDVETARELLDAEADLNQSHPVHGNALVIAGAGGHEELALYLLKQGADPGSADETGITALHHAVGGGMSYLNGVIYDPVYRLRPENSLPLARALLEAGADANARIAEEHILGPDGTPFSMVGATPLLLAAASADLPMLRLLREFGADPHINTVEGVTPLMAAAQSACTGTCAYQAGGNVANQEDIQAALRAVSLVVDMGVDVNAASIDGQTAMHIAAFTGADTVVRYLAEHGAGVNVVNDKGETPWSMASGISADIGQAGLYGVHENTAALLLELGADKIRPPEDGSYSLSGDGD